MLVCASARPLYDWPITMDQGVSDTGPPRLDFMTVREEKFGRDEVGHLVGKTPSSKLTASRRATATPVQVSPSTNMLWR